MVVVYQTICRRLCLTTALIAPATVISAPAWAAELNAQPAAATEISEVVVSALKRDENLQDVPATLQVTSGLTLAQQAVTSVQQLKTLAPGLYVRQGTSDTAWVSLRGLGTSITSGSLDNSIGFFTDGVFTGHTRFFNQALFDLDHVELLKGTQAALLGRNTSLGGLVTVTRKPGQDFEADVLASYEFELGSSLVSLGTDIPISDTFKLRIAAQRADNEGWVYDTTTHHWGAQNVNNGVRLTGVWTPTSAFDVTGVFQATATQRTGNAAEFINDYAHLFHGGSLYSGNPAAPGGYPGDTVFNFRTDMASFLGDGHTTNDSQLGVVTANYRFSNGVTFTSLTGYLHSSVDFVEGQSAAYWNSAMVYGKEFDQQYSQEFRLTSPSQGRLRYVAGVYASRDEWNSDQDYPMYGAFAAGPYNGANPPPTPPSPSFPPYTAPVFTQPPLSGYLFDAHDTLTNTLAPFGQLTFDLTGKLSFNVSGRYTYELREVHFIRVVPQGLGVGVVDPTSPVTRAGGLCLINNIASAYAFTPTCTTAGGGFAGYGKEAVSKGYPDGSIGFDYRPADRVLLYASYNQGTKGANFVNNIFARAAVPVAKEVAKTAEVGAKTTFRDLPIGDLRVNLSLFDTRIDGLQVVVYLPASTTAGNRNVESRGADLDIDWNPLPGLTVGGDFEYVDAFNRASPGDPTPVGPGTPVAVSPKWSGLIHADYKHKLTDRFTFTAQPSVNFRSTMSMREKVKPGANPCNPTAAVFTYACQYPLSPGYAMVNLRLAISDTVAGWDVALVGKNLTDKHVFNYMLPATTGFGTLVTSEPPRTIALTFSKSF